ncbi:hypothetical protein ABTY20_18975 [Streptomyces sp. NPDC126497]|uniref:hypothetical protein n=1 Tax=Streptomyces sp. NPDC126497 TaxID=3155313 RepID=UPI0033209175
MTQSTPERAPCAVCGKECSVNADGTVRHHTTNNPDWQANPEPHTSNKCKGAGEKPAGAAEALTTGGSQCRLCKHPVELTGNGRVRSHLTPEQTPRPCPGGSDFPLGTYPDMVGTTDGLVASLAVDCGHVPAGQCYGCYGAAGNPVSDGELDAMAEAQGRGEAPWGVSPESVTQPTMADQFTAAPLTEALARETSGVGTVLDVMDDDMRAEAERFMAAAKGPDDTPRTDRPKGFDPACGKCGTDDHRCPGCGTDVRHGVVACDDCERELLARKLPAGRTEDGRRCEHHDAVFGVEDDRLVCVACGTPCTHPDGFTENDPVEDDGEGLVFRCALCGAVDSGGDEAAGPDLDPRDVMGQVRRDAAAVRAATGSVRVGDLEHGDVFARRGTAMRVTSAGYGVVEAIVVDNGPHAGRTGELKNPDEVVERIAAGPKEQETTECADETMPQQRPASSATSSTRTTTPTALAPGSPQRTGASAPVSPQSESVTSSAPTARAAGRGGSAAVATDQATAAAAFLSGGRPATPASTGAQGDQAAAAAQFLAGGSGAHGEKETKRDRYGRYLIPHPDTGKEQAWTRATTFAKSISDTYALSQWGLRMALIGATMRPDIVKRAHGKHVRADKKLLDELTAELKTAAGDKVAANLGTSMHSFTEMADRAWHSPGGPRSILDQVPPDCRDDVETYIRLLEETGLEPVPHLIEFTTVVKQYGVAGTSDNCYKVTKPLTLKIGRAEVRLAPGEYVIGDKKTGRDLDYGWQEIAIQLGTYAQGINTSGVWDRHDEVWHPDPLSRFDKPGTKVRTDAGIVVHLPVDKSVDESEKKEPAVYGIDLESGWNAAVLCERVRAWRNVRTLASPVMVSEADTFAPSRSQPEAVVSRTAVRPPTLREKANAVTSKGDASAVWQEATAAGLSRAEVDELVTVMQARLRELAEPGG